MDFVVLKDEQRTARKIYKCDATAWLRACGLARCDLDPDQHRALDAADADKGCILRGQKYRYQRGVFEGRMCTWRARLDVQKVCQSHGLLD